MKHKIVYYWKEEDILDIYFGKGKEVNNSRELENVNLIIDFNKKGDVIGVEIFDFVKAMERSQKKINKLFKKRKQ